MILNERIYLSTYIKGWGSGEKVWIEENMLAEMTVGDINQDLSKTALYNQFQYQSVNAKTWADKAYVMNEGA